MFGTNPIRKTEYAEEGSLWVKSVFYTLQGEGIFSGDPAVFIRLAGCNLRCYWCDTDFENSDWYPDIGGLVKHVDQIASTAGTSLVVITGGEPMRQNITQLCLELMRRTYTVQIETAGTVVPPGLLSLKERAPERLYIICSPKTGKVAAELVPMVDAWKYIIQAGGISEEDGLPTASTQVEGKECQIFRAPEGSLVYVQPMDEQDEQRNWMNLIAARDICLMYGYRLNIQLHKLVEVE